jgi:amidase/aspartyl-tRNA(Asn)/glutamyl-tRNA(Gln) amidotransferase subunit A
VANAARPDAFFTGRDQFVYHGALARTVKDAALMLSVMSGPDPRDPLSLPGPVPDFVAASRSGITGMRVAYSRTFGGFPVEAEVKAVVDDAVEAFETAGAVVDEVDLALPRPQAELSSVWRRGVSVYYAHMLRGMEKAGITPPDYRELLTPDFRAYVELGEALSAAEYRADDLVRTEVVEMLATALATHDVLVTPTVAVAGVENADDGQTRGPAMVDGEAVDPMIGWVLTYPVNFAGLPAASVPAGWMDPEGLPVGMQIIGRRFHDRDVIAAAAAFERVRPWHARYVRLATGPDAAA